MLVNSVSYLSTKNKEQLLLCANAAANFKKQIKNNMRNFLQILFKLSLLISINVYSQSLPMAYTNTVHPSSSQPLILRSQLNSTANNYGTIVGGAVVAVNSYQQASTAVQSTLNSSTTKTFGVVDLPAKTNGRKAYVAIGVTFTNPNCNFLVGTITAKKLNLRTVEGASNPTVKWNGDSVFLFSGQIIAIVETKSVTGNGTWYKLILPSSYSQHFAWVHSAYVSSSYTGSNGLFPAALNLSSYNSNSVSLNWTIEGEPNGFTSATNCNHLIEMDNGSGFSQFGIKNSNYPINNSFSKNHSFANAGTYSFRVQSSYGSCNSTSNTVSFIVNNLCVPSSSSSTVSICKSQTPYNFFGQWLSNTGTYSHTITNGNSCGKDSTINLDLTVLEAEAPEIDTIGLGSVCPNTLLTVNATQPANISSWSWSIYSTQGCSIVSGNGSPQIQVQVPSTATGQFYITCKTISNDGCESNSVTATALINCALPVKFTSFNTEAKCSDVSLKWTTANEANNKEFVIQKSKDGINFSDVISIKPNSSMEYSFIENKLENGIYFFRIKQVDFDGKFSFSKLNKVDVNCSSNVLTVYPNPTVNNLYVSIPKNEKGAVFVLDISGKVLIKKDVIANGNIEINVSNLVAGIYMLEFVTTKNVMYKAKFIKL